MVAGLASIAGAPAAAQPDVVTFGYTGEEERFVVPAGVTSIGVVATGAKGQRGQDYLFPGPGGPGGFGARVASELAVTPGQVLYVRVGGPGVAGGFNGGGPGATGNAFLQSFGGNGGGATDLRTCPTAAAVCPDGTTDSLASRVVVAGGGGGGGGGNGGQPQLAGTGGSAQTGSRVGGSGTDSEYLGFGGGGAQGGQVDAPGDGGVGRNGGEPGLPGSGPDGGAGGSGGGNAGHGAGGGGGWFGGGGGGAGFGGGGGGAGSSYGPEGTVYGVDTTGVSSLVIYFAAPKVATGPADSVTETAADLNGLVNPQAQDTTWWFEYGADTSYGRVTPAAPGAAGAGVESVPVATTLSGLEPGTTYHFRLAAVNAAGTSVGADRTFTTPPADPVPPVLPPTVSTGAATAITGTTATVGASVNPMGRDTTWQIELGETTGDVRTVPVPAADAGSGMDPVAVSVPVSGLAPGTTHWYRVIATNSAGTSEGIFRSFMTRPSPTRTVPIEPARRADLRLSVTSASARPRVGRTLGLRVRLANRGPGVARNVAVTVALPRGIRFAAASRGCVARSRVVTCVSRAVLPPRRARSFVLRTRPAFPGRVAVDAVARSSTPDPGGARVRLPLRVGR